MVSFCPKCGALLVPSGDKKNLVCSCGYKSRSKKDLKMREKNKVEAPKKVDINEKETLAKVEEECPKCGKKDAYNWSMQTRAADEPETQFFRCSHCNHTWREYS